MAKRLGRRGVLLFLGGMAWILAGLSMYAAPYERFSAPGYYPSVLEYFDQAWIGLVWVAAGTVAMTAGALHSRKRASTMDVVGFNAWLTPPLIFACLHFWSIVAWLWSGGTNGNVRSGFGLLIWFMISLVIVIVAGWPDPQDPAAVARERPRAPRRRE